MIKINNRYISKNNPVFFIADIAANHDGNLNRALELIHLAAESGADAAKFQHFSASTIVSKFGFESLPNNLKSHQKKWNKSVFDVYSDASLNIEWNQILKEECDKVGIIFFTSPYSIELVDEVDSLVPAYKIGSGDITWDEIIRHIALKNKPYMLATGASSIEEVIYAVDKALTLNKDLILMQCNTNYTASLDNFRYINLNVLKKYSEIYPNLVLGLSDHTPGHSTVLGAVALGARVIEKHFTDDNNRKGPDHLFSMNPNDWKEMVLRTQELELALGDGVKRIESNESETVILQRRSIRLNKNKKNGDYIKREDLIPLRPCPNDALPLKMIDKIEGMQLKRDIFKR